MIKNIFLPQQLHSYYLFSQKIIAFEVGKKSVFATVVRAHRAKKSIQNFVEEPYNADDAHSLVEAIKRIMVQVGPCDSVYIALPSNKVIFKEVSLPLAMLNKIRLVLPFEVESLLPFPLQDAVLDGIVNSTDTATNTAHVFVAAMKRTNLTDYVQPFLDAGLHPTKVTLSALELYALTHALPIYNKPDAVSVIIDLDHGSTQIILVVKGMVENIRTLPQGFDIELMRLDLESHSKNADLNQTTKDFFASVQFTLQAALMNTGTTEPISQVILAGYGSQIPGITHFMEQILSCPCIVLQPHKIVQSSSIVLEAGSSIPTQYTTTLATALEYGETAQFNLGTVYAEEKEYTVFKKQVLTTLALVTLFLGSFFAYRFFMVKKLRNEIEQAKQQTIQRLSQDFELPASKNKRIKNVSAVVNEARQKLTVEENIWFALSPANRLSFLQYLQELATHIDRDKIGLQMKRLTLKSAEGAEQDIMILEGAVRNYDAVRTLETNLKDTHLFTFVPELQETKFNLVLTINKDEKEAL